jgi:hypothetical protein
MGSGFDDWIYWHFDYSYNQLWQLTISDGLRLAPILTGLRASSFLRDWPGSDLGVGRFFSFRCPPVNTPQLNTQLLNSLTNESLQFTNELSFIISGGPNSSDRLQGFHYRSSWMRCLGNVHEPLPSERITPCLAPMFRLLGGVYRAVAWQMVIFHHNTIIFRKIIILNKIYYF